MEDKKNNGNQLNMENGSKTNDNNNKKADSEKNDTTLKISLEPNSGPSKEEKKEKDNIELNQTKLSKIEQTNLSETNENTNNESLTKGSNETQNKENEKDKFINDLELIKEIKKDNYKKFYLKNHFCDYRKRDDNPWEVGQISEISEDKIIVDDKKKGKKYPILINDSSKISYLRKYSHFSKNNHFQRRRKKDILDRLLYLEEVLKDDNLLKNSSWEIYYTLHSKIYFGLDNAVVINKDDYDDYEDDNNEGGEESFRFILLILNFLCRYYKYILDNKDEFINYQNNIVNTELDDLKLINKKYAFFSFFETSLDLLDKIFANSSTEVLKWYKIFEDELMQIAPSFRDIKTKPNPQFYPLYEKEEENDEKEEEDEKGKDEKEKQIKSVDTKNNLLLKRICLSKAYNSEVTYTSNKFKIKAGILAYFIDYFNAFNGFSYLFQLCYCSKLIKLDLLLEILRAFSYTKVMTDNYKNICDDEKKKLIDFIYNFIDNLNEKRVKDYNEANIIELIEKGTSFFDNKTRQKHINNLFFNYTAKTLLLSKKLEQKISSLNEINQLLKIIKKEKICYINKNLEIKMSLEEFALYCQKNNLLKLLLSDKSVHEEIIKRLPDIFFIMYKYNFGYINKEKEKEKINTDKKMIFNVLFDKLIESEQNNEKLVKTIQNLICQFGEILSEEDKIFFFEEIKKYLEKSIEKKGIPMKDNLLFMIDFFLKSADTNDENRKEEDKENSDDKKNEERTENNDLKKNKYYGPNLLLNYLSEEMYKKYSMTNEQKIDLIRTAIEGINKIIDKYEEKEKDSILKNMILKVESAINNSKDIIQHLILFQKLRQQNLNLKNYSKNDEILSNLMKDMNRYLSLINKNNKTNNEKEDMEKEGSKIYEGLFDNKLNIKIRLELIFILLGKKLNEENLNNFHKEVINSCESIKFVNDYLYKYIYDNLEQFNLGFIQFFFDKILLSKEKLSNVDDLEYFKLCNEIIKVINKTNKRFYFMNKKDLAVINFETEKEIKGLDLLWNFLIKTKNKKIRSYVTDFLADIFFGIRIGKEKTENFWKNFIKSIYDRLDEIIKLENDNKDQGKNDESIHGIISLIKKIENKFSSKGEIINDINEISKEIQTNKKQFKILEQEKNNEENKKSYSITISYSGKVYGTDNILNYDSVIDGTEYFYMFRYKLSNYFKIPLNLVKVVIDESKYNKEIKEKLKTFQFDLFNDFDNTYLLFDNIEKKINKDNLNNSNENPLSLKIEVIKDSEKSKYIKKLIKDFPKLLQLLKRKNSEYLLDVWCLIKEDNIIIDPSIIEIIKQILKEENSEAINSVFKFEDTNIYYLSYILFHLSNVINELNKNNDKFINNIFLKSKIWNEKIKSIKLENSANPHLGEIYEKNNVISYLLNIYKIISQKSDDKNTLIFILHKIFEYYYQTINECISINLRGLPSTEGIPADLVEDLYITNVTIIKEIIIQNRIIYDTFINILLNKDNLNLENSDNKIKSQFEFLFTEGLIKNRLYALNEKLKSFLLIIADDRFFAQSKNQTDNSIIINDFYFYLLNFFLSIKGNKAFINCIKDLSLDNRLIISLNIDKYENNIKLYFDIIIDIIDRFYPLIKNNFNFKSYIDEILLKKIYNPIIEDIPLEFSYHEIVFGGYCQILLNLLQKTNYLDKNGNEEKKLKNYLFNEIIMNNCNKNIFTEKNIDNYKSLSISSSFAFKKATNLFIFLLMQNIQNENESEINYLFEKLTELHRECYWKGNNISDWKLDFKDNNRLSPFVGLKNLGCTCYMNSLFQVFFNFIPFRESLLRCKCKEEKKNSLYQLKKIFYSLKYLQINYYTPSDFPNNYDDEQLNVHLQMDADEFFGNILDKIENRLKNTKNENLVKYFFQGRQNDKLTFQEGCPHHRTNIINFYSIQLQIQNKNNIYESLDTLTEGELMNGDNCIYCPECKNKFPAVKSQNFKTLPRMLIFVLKRFEFNYETMKRVKINDYYEFPLELDMTKYISEKKNDVNLNKYKLKSVVVHMGHSEGGHYYAFIKNKNDNWYEYNDTQITQFDINLLKEEAFGGKDTITKNGNKQIIEKDRSAYLLFYEKIDQTDCEQFENIEAINCFLNLNTNNNTSDKIENNKNIENGATDVNKSKDLTDINKISEDENENGNGMKEILENINKEMYKYFLNKKLFSNEYQYFILELYLNILNYYYSFDLSVFLLHLCRNSNNRETLKEMPSLNSNINLYIEKKKLILFAKEKKLNYKPKQNSKEVLNLFKHFIQYFYNVFLRTKDKDYIGVMVDLMKFFLNDSLDCSHFLIEEFCNRNVIIEYLINCPIYEIKKLIVGIIYCAMIKSIGEYEISKLKEENDLKKVNNNKNKDKNQNKSQKTMLEDEEIARQLNNDYLNDNPIEYDNIPNNVLKMIYNILYIIIEMKYKLMNEERFLFFIIYRFSLISQNTRVFLINKCRVFELLCLLLHKKYATYNYDIQGIIDSINFGLLFEVSHDILNTKGKKEEKWISDKVGMYKYENYIYLLFFHLLSFTPDKNIKLLINEDRGFFLDNKDFVKVLLNNIRTKQDAFGFSNYINEKCKNNKNRIIPVFETLIAFLNKIDNNENINYDYNNYTNFNNSNMNESPNDNDPGINPKYLLIIFKRFISILNPKTDYVQKGIKYIFHIFWENKQFYNYCIMVIDFIIEIFSLYLRGYISTFKKELEQLIIWFEQNSIAPTLYHIEGISLYKYQRKNYDNNISESEKEEFIIKEIEKTQNKIKKINALIHNEPIDEKFKIEKDLSDFKFIIGDVILYDGKEVVIEEALDESIKITIEKGKKNGKKKGAIEKEEIWVETDSPKIEIKDLQ